MLPLPRAPSTRWSKKNERPKALILIKKVMFPLIPFWVLPQSFQKRPQAISQPYLAPYID